MHLSVISFTFFSLVGVILHSSIRYWILPTMVSYSERTGFCHREVLGEGQLVSPCFSSLQKYKVQSGEPLTM
uniref:Uncharacterized protein n=1 Tax=Anguilla anguilla TaxID=7936 RepID=A0A0E9X8K4_ANGAN